MELRQKTFKICSINICGLSSRSKLVLENYVQEEVYDVLCIQETETTDANKIKLCNMNNITDTNKASNRGASVHVKEKHTISKLEVISKPFNNIDSSWGLAILGNQRLIIGSVYAKLNYQSAIEDILKMLDKAQEMCPKLRAKGVILLGDFNARNTVWGDSITNEYGHKLLNNLDSTKFEIMTSTTPTFLAENGSSFIDLVVVSQNLTEKISEVKTDPDIELFSGAPIRGHVPLILNISMDCPREAVLKQEKTDLSKICWSKWSSDLDLKLAETNSDTVNAQELWNEIEEAIQEVTSHHASTKISCKHSKPYWSETLSELSKKLKEARKTYRYRNTDNNKNKMYQAKENFDCERKKACQEFILNKTKKLNSVQAQHFWKEFNQIFKKRSECRIDPIEQGEELISDNNDIEEIMFATFFEGTHLKDENFDEKFYDEVNKLYFSIKLEESKPVNRGEAEGNQDFNINSKISIKEIETCIKACDANGKSFDNKNFHPVMMKHFGKYTLQVLCKLFNLCLDTSAWVWDEAEVIFLKKEGKESYAKPGSYRPISISAYIGKMFERIIAQRYIKFLTVNKLWDSDQEGFTKYRNTIRYLNRLHLGIKEDIEEKRTSISLFIDFEKAFDSVWKKGLLVKIHKLGVKGKIWLLTDKFLHSRKVKLNINGEKGNIRESSDVGLPQGSALSPILFKIYLIDFASDLENKTGITKLKFADDGTIKATATSTPQCIALMEEVLKSVRKWTLRWRMVINCQPNKTEIITFSTAENNCHQIPEKFYIGKKEVKVVGETKVLGLTIDNKLSYKPHSALVLKKLNFKWHQISTYCNRNTGLNQRVMVSLIRTLFISCLCYAGHLWMKKQNLQEINKLWYKILKTTIGAVFNISLSTAEMILGLPPILIQNKINRIKHYLKLCMNKAPGDRLIDYISLGNLEKPQELKLAIKEVVKFLEWKILYYPEQFNETDSDIINTRKREEFFQLSDKSCSYNKSIMDKYTELLWSDAVRNEYQQKGEHFIPTPSCKPLVIPEHTSRSCEVLIMSLMYKQNLLNEFLYQRNLVNSDVCPNCDEDIQDAHHILFSCSAVSEHHREEVYSELCKQTGQDHADVPSATAVLMGSRNKQFIKTCRDIVESQSLRTSIELYEVA